MNPRLRSKLIITATLLGAVAFVAGPSHAQSSEFNARLMACRAIGDVTARVACYDRLADGLRPAPPSAVTAPVVPAPPVPPVPTSQPQRPVAPPVMAAPAPTSRFGADDLPLQKRDPEAAQLPNQIVAKAVAVTADRQGYVTVTLDNGQTWRQTEGPEMRILPGAEVKIRSAMMGSYLLSLTSGNRSVRAKRVN